MKKLFTLIELIVVIVVIGILAAIVIPNISSFKEDATTASIESNGKNIQTSVDMFKLKEGNIPTLDGNTASIGSPKQVAFSKLKPNYLRGIPKNGFYWIDYTGQVIYSDADTPLGVENKEGQLSWQAPNQGEVASYRIYAVGEKLLGAAKITKVDFISETNETTYLLKEQEKGYTDYLVASVSRNGFVSPGISQDTIYTGIDLSEVPEENVESGEDTPPIPEPVKKTPTAFGSVSTWGNLTLQSNEGSHNIFAVGENTEVYYSPQGKNTLMVDTFNKVGERISSKTISNYSGFWNRSISNLDAEGNRYIFTHEGDLHRLNPDGNAELIAKMHTYFKTDAFRIYKPGIKVEGDLAYLSYVKNDTSQPVLAIFNLKTKQLISHTVNLAVSVSGSDESNILLTEDYVYTAMLKGHEGTNSDILLFKWDKRTGKSLASYVYDTPTGNYNAPTMFKDTNGGIWFTESRTPFNNKVSIKVHQMNLDTFRGLTNTVIVPDLTNLPAVSDSVVREDGSIELFYQSLNTLKSIKFE